MAGGNNARERHSWPMMSRMDRMLLRARSFEAEDAEDIPEVFRVQQPRELKSSSRVSLHKILGPCQELGRRPRTPVRGQSHFTVEERRASFAGAWDGPPPDVMALCGMFKVTHDSARCYCCGVTFRGVAEDTCMWTLHGQFAPNCLHHQRARAHGKTGNVLKFVRCFSTSDSMGLM